CAPSSAPLLSPTPPPPALHSLPLHDALPIYGSSPSGRWSSADPRFRAAVDLRHSSAPGRSSWFVLEQSCGSLHISPMWSEPQDRSEEHTSELQSRFDLVCRLLPETHNQNAQA